MDNDLPSRRATFSPGYNTRCSRIYFIYSLYSVFYSIPFLSYSIPFQGPWIVLCTSPLTVLGNYVIQRGTPISDSCECKRPSRNFVTRAGLPMQFVGIPPFLFFFFFSTNSAWFPRLCSSVIKSKDPVLRGWLVPTGLRRRKSTSFSLVNPPTWPKI